jgi:hypothetical protein
MLDGLVPELAPRLLIAIGGVGVALLALVVVLIFLKRRNLPLFVKGGRAREPRLLVMDAAAVDARRRLVLIRRDDTEHLIMIGGPTDIVIETGIGAPGAPQRREAVQPAGPSADRVAAADAAMRGPAVKAEPQLRPVQQEPRAERPAPQSTAAAQALPAQTQRPAADTDTVSFASLVPGAESSGHAAIDPEDVLDAARQRVIPSQAPAVVRDEDAIRALEARLEASKAEAARQEAARAEAARQQAARIEAEKAEASRRQAERAEMERAEAQAREAELARREAQRAEAARRDAERLEAERQQAERAEAQRQEAERREIARQQAERAEAERLQAEKQRVERLEAERREAERLRAERAEAERLEAERQEAERQAIAEAEAARLAAEQAETIRRQAEKAEADRIQAARQEADRIAAARAEAMARFEAARRAQAQRPESPVPAAYVAAEALAPSGEDVGEPETDADDDQPADNDEADNAARQAQQRLASDFEKLLEAELEAGGIIDARPIPEVTAERREAGLAAPMVQPASRETLPITGATPGNSAEQDMARRLGEISLGRRNDPPSNL